MKSFRIAATVIGATLVLTGCGALNAFIPDQEVTNAYGLDDKPVTLEPATATTTSFEALALASAFEATVAGTFDDVDTSAIPDGIKPNAVREVISISNTMTVTPTVIAEAPDTLTLVGASLGLTLSDGDAADVSASFTKSDLAVVFTKGTCTVTSCTYTAEGDATELFNAKIDGADFAGVWTLLTNGTQPNTANATLGITFETAVDADNITVRLQTSKGLLMF